MFSRTEDLAFVSEWLTKNGLKIVFESAIIVSLSAKYEKRLTD